MKNGNLAPTFRSLFLCMLWHGDTRSTPWPFTAFVESLPCMCHTDGTWDGWDYRHTRTCAWDPTRTSVMQFPTVLWTKRCTLQAWIFFCLFYLNIWKGEGYQVRHDRSSLPTNMSGYFQVESVFHYFLAWVKLAIEAQTHCCSEKKNSIPRMNNI